jgi:hypothetical protein
MGWLVGYFICPMAAFAQSGVPSDRVEIPSSFNPVGSGARAIGMGGAFIAVADDATAASWNPGGLIQLTAPEFSLVTSGFSREEAIEFGTNPEAEGSHRVTEGNINYLSAAYPFGLFNRNMVVSLSYQHLYDFTRDWQFRLGNPLLGTEEAWNYQQTGRLSALGISYCVQLVPQLSLGITLNLWDDDLTDNQWQQDYTSVRSMGGMPMAELNKKETYSLSGFNANVGLLWRATYKLTIGAVLKTPFKADVKHDITERQVYKMPPEDMVLSESTSRDEEIEMPMSWGIGLAYRFSDKFFISGDIYRTEWDDFVYKDENGNENNPVSGLPVNESDIEPTHQVRIGAEYRLMNEKKGYIIPLRAGIFYDPAPAEGSPDDFYGFSIGSGFTENNRFSIDIAYQYRFGRDVGKSVLQSRNFSQDVDEHMLYLSIIFYP